MKPTKKQNAKSIEKHRRSPMHGLVMEWLVERPDVFKITRKIFRTPHFVNRNDIASMVYDGLIKSQESNGIDLGTHLHSRHSEARITITMSKILQAEVRNIVF